MNEHPQYLADTLIDEIYQDILKGDMDVASRRICQALVAQIRKDAEIVRNSLIEHPANGSASAWIECTKTPLEIERAILAQLEEKKA